MAGLVIGIDIGTSGVRAVAMTGALDVAASADARLATYSSDHRDPTAWLQAFHDTLQALLAQIDRSAVVAISIDGTSGTVLPVDAQGTPIAAPLMYNDPVPDEVLLARIAGHAPRTSAAHGATSGLAKVLLFQTIPGVTRVIHQADWLSGQLSGRFDVSDENNALKTGYDPVQRCWPDWMAKTGVLLNLLPQVLPAGSPIGTISADAAKLYGLPGTVLIVAGTTDGCASFLATGADQPGDGVSALGSTLTVKLLSDRPLFAPEYGLYSHRIGDLWLAGGASNSGGIVLSAHFTNDEIVTLSSRLDPSVPTGLDYYPLLKAGERFPINDPGLMPRMEPRPLEKSVFLQAIFEGIAGIEALSYERLAGLGAPALKSVRSVGGGAKNDVWTQLRADRLQVPFLSAASEEAAAGTARLTLAGAKAAGMLA